MQEHYLAKWLNDELTPEELKTFEQSKEYASYKKIADTAKQFKTPEFDVEAAYNKIKERNSTKVVKLNPWRIALRIAAVFAIIFISYWYISNLDTIVNTQIAQQTEILLPDESKVLLNANSTLTYNKKDWKNERDVILEGEAFFKVATGQKFNVNTANGIVSVLGTQFNVKNRKDFFEVTCYEGLVSVSTGKNIIKLPAGTTFLIINKQVVEHNNILETKPSWLLHESSFRSIPLAYVLDELKDQYNISIETTVDLSILFTGTFTHKDLTLALKSISIPLDLTYKVKDNTVTLYEAK